MQPANPRQAYIPIVHNFIPKAKGRQLATLCEMLYLRDLSTKALSTKPLPGDLAFGAHSELIEAVSKFWLIPLSDKGLTEIFRHVQWLESITKKDW